MTRPLIVAIDGPSGAGKSTLSRQLAQALGYTHIDTGAMYRAVALAAAQRGVHPEDAEALERLCASLVLRFLRQPDGSQRVLLDGVDVTEAIRTPANSLLTSRVSAQPVVRAAMVALQRQMGEDGSVVLEGRDIGSVVFPQAQVKFFLTATAEERGRRRYEELRAQGLSVTLEQTVADVVARDRADSERSHAPLVAADDAILVDSSQLAIDQVLQQMLEKVRERRRQ